MIVRARETFESSSVFRFVFDGQQNTPKLKDNSTLKWKSSQMLPLGQGPLFQKASSWSCSNLEWSDRPLMAESDCTITLLCKQSQGSALAQKLWNAFVAIVDGEKAFSFAFGFLSQHQPHPPCYCVLAQTSSQTRHFVWSPSLLMWWNWYALQLTTTPKHSLVTVYVRAWLCYRSLPSEACSLSWDWSKIGHLLLCCSGPWPEVPSGRISFRVKLSFNFW